MKLKYFPFAFICLNVVGGLIFAAANGLNSGAGAFIAFNLALLAVAAASFSLARFAMRRKAGRAKVAIDEIAARAFDSATTVSPTFESSLVGGMALLGPGGKLDESIGFTAQGTVRGVATKIATCVSSAGRQRFEMSHVYSYVSVDAENAAGRFNFIGRDAYSKWAGRFGTLPDNKLGDADFDGAWVVAGDPDLARDVLDAELRTKLVQLQNRAHDVSTVGMSIELTGSGLVVRWPGEIDAELAVTLRDLALRLRDRQLEVLRRQGLIDGPTAVRVDASATETPRNEDDAPLGSSAGAREKQLG